MFDIDHLYLTSYNYNVIKDKNGKTTQLTKEFKELNSKYHQNAILDMMMILLKDTDNSLNSLYKSIDNDTSLITDIAKTLSRGETNQEQPYNFGSLHEQVTRRNDYITGKTGIGPFALNVTSNVLTYLYGVNFNPNKDICKYTRIGRLDMSIDLDGNAIASWISAFINAHVDIVKDPYISLFNVNSYTYNLINLLVRSGYGTGALYFCIQPVIKAMAEASNNYSSKYTKSRKNKKSRNAVILEAANSVMGTDIKENQIQTTISRKLSYQIDDSGDSYKMSYGTYCVFKVFKDIQEGKTPNQEEVFYAFQALKPYSNALSNLVKYTKIDTRKQGKTFIEMQRYLDQYDRMFHSRTQYGRPLESKVSIWDTESLGRLINHTWIEYKTRNGILEPMRVLSNLVFDANQDFINTALYYADLLIDDDSEIDTTKLLKQLSQAMKTQIKAKFINDYAAEGGINIKSLFVGNKSMAILVDRLKYLVANNDKYKHLQNNALLNALVSTPSTYKIMVGMNRVESPRFVNIVRKLDGGAIDENPLIDAWEDLLNDPVVQNFARKLIIYAFITSGEGKKMNSLFKYVPTSFLRGELQYSTANDMSFADYIQHVLTYSSEMQDQLNLDEIVQNNYNDFNLVKKVSLTYRDESGMTQNRFRFIANSQDANAPLVLVSVLNEDANSPYICVSKKGTFVNQCLSVNLYKRVHPGVYMLMPKKGFKDKNNYIYEYSGDYGFAFNQNLGFSYDKVQNAYKYLTNLLSSIRFRIKDDFLIGPFSQAIAKQMLEYDGTSDLTEQADAIVNWYNKTQLKEVEIGENKEQSQSGLNITNIVEADRKAKAKAFIATQFIGFADGIQGSSTASYVQQAGDKANTGNYSSSDVIFVSIPGKRGDATVRHEQQRRTIDEAIKALNAGATLITDNKDYVQLSDYNEGEKLLAEALTNAGAMYSERVVKGYTLGVWNKSTSNEQQNNDLSDLDRLGQQRREECK